MGATATYEDRKKREAERQREISRQGRDIGTPPAVANMRRRNRCQKNLKSFLLTYFPEAFPLPFSEDHLRVIKTLERVIRKGGLFAIAMPRSSGKTTITERAVLWAILYGYRRYVVLVGPSKDKAHKLIATIKMELQSNEMLAEDFPEICHAIAALEDIANRARGQTCQGRQTHIKWGKHEINLPFVDARACIPKGSKVKTLPNGCGATIISYGITEAIRGEKRTLPSGENVRPDLFLADDPQTDKSAKSETMCDDRERTLLGAVKGLSGLKSQISGVVLVTVIRQGDLSDRLLDRKRLPQFQGERTRLLEQFPADKDKWAEYAELRKIGLMEGDEGRQATEFYRKHRKQMDVGAIANWKHRFEQHELSAIQHAMNLKIDDERSFQAEYQNDPLPELIDLVSTALERTELAQRTNGLEPGILPRSAEILTMFVDVQLNLLYWMACAWDYNFSGAIVGYGSWPAQTTGYYTLSGVTRTLQTHYPGMAIDARTAKAIEDLTDALTHRHWVREDGTRIDPGRLLIDARWGKTAETVKTTCWRSPYRSIILPSHGIYFGASRQPLNHGPRRGGERRGPGWKIPPKNRGDVGRRFNFDTNYWKSFVAQRLTVPVGDPGSLSLFGRDGARTHAMLIDHLVAEKAVEVEANERKVEEWQLPPSRPDNHFWDCLVGCAASASEQGAALLESTAKPKSDSGKRVKFSEVQRKKREARGATARRHRR